MVHLIIGIVCTSLFFLFMQFLQKKGIIPGAGKTALILLEILYMIFVLELIYGFIMEGAVKGALVMGLIFGFPCIVAGLLLYRWILKASKNK